MSERTFSAMSIAEITKSDSVTLQPFPVALFIGGAGDVALQAVGGGQAVFTVAAGTVLPVQVGKVLSTGTAEKNITSLYN